MEQWTRWFLNGGRPRIMKMISKNKKDGEQITSISGLTIKFHHSDCAAAMRS